MSEVLLTKIGELAGNSKFVKVDRRRVSWNGKGNVPQTNWGYGEALAILLVEKELGTLIKNIHYQEKRLGSKLRGDFVVELISGEKMLVEVKTYKKLSKKQIIDFFNNQLTKLAPIFDASALLLIHIHPQTGEYQFYFSNDIKEIKDISELSPTISFSSVPRSLNNMVPFQNKNEIVAFFNTLHDFLRSHGIIEGRAMEVIFNFLIAKIYDEEMLAEKRYKTPRFIKGGDIEGLYKDANKAYFRQPPTPFLADVEQNAKQQIIDYIVSKLQWYKLTATKGDWMGEAFQQIVALHIRQSRGMFFTPKTIGEFLVSKIKDKQYILDPSAGSAGLLLLTPTNTDITGIEYDPFLAKLAFLNVKLHDRKGAIIRHDALKLKIPNVNNGFFEAIVSNPPFSVIVHNPDQFRMSKFVTAEKQSEFFFVERWWYFLEENGEISVVLPMNVLDSSNLKAVLFVFSLFKPVEIVRIPEYAFAPYARQVTVLLHAKRRPEKFVKWALEKLEANDLDPIINEFQKELLNWADVKQIGYYIKKKGNNIIVHQTPNELISPDYSVISLHDLLIKLNPSYRKHFGESNVPEWIEVKSAGKYSKDKEATIIVETGDIIKHKLIPTPKEVEHARIEKKIRRGGFVKVPSGVVLIAPARPYQKKITFYDEKLMGDIRFSKDFIAVEVNYDIIGNYIDNLPTDEKGKLITSLIAFRIASLLLKVNLTGRTGKAGYEKINAEDVQYLVDWDWLKEELAQTDWEETKRQYEAFKTTYRYLCTNEYL